MCTYIARAQKSGDWNSAQPQEPSTGVNLQSNILISALLLQENFELNLAEKLSG